MGRLTKDPDARRTTTGKSVTSFTLAVARDINKDEADFIDVVTWNSTAEFAGKYLTKGSMIEVNGRLQFREWEDKDGNKRRNAEINAFNLYLVERKKTDTKPQNALNVDAEDFEEVSEEDDNLPF